MAKPATKIFVQVIDGKLVCPICGGESQDVLTYYEMAMQYRDVGGFKDGQLQIAEDYDIEDLGPDGDPHLRCSTCQKRIEIPEGVGLNFSDADWPEEDEVN
jgi:hypothetical protein